MERGRMKEGLRKGGKRGREGWKAEWKGGRNERQVWTAYQPPQSICVIKALFGRCGLPTNHRREHCVINQIL